MQKICVIKTSVSTEVQASTLATGLVEVRLAACVQVSGTGLSVYRWQDKVEHEQEYYLNIKTRPEMCEAVVGWLSDHHPYETPEIFWSVCDANDEYADWLAVATDSKQLNGELND